MANIPLPSNIVFSGADLNGDTLNINTTYSSGVLLDSQQNPKAGYGGTFTAVKHQQWMLENLQSYKNDDR